MKKNHNDADVYQYYLCEAVECIRNSLYAAIRERKHTKLDYAIGENAGFQWVNWILVINASKAGIPLAKVCVDSDEEEEKRKRKSK